MTAYKTKFDICSSCYGQGYTPNKPDKVCTLCNGTKSIAVLYITKEDIILPEVEKEKITSYIQRHISELNAADAEFCEDRWNMSLPHYQRFSAREMSNQVTFARQELQQVLLSYPKE